MSSYSLECKNQLKRRHSPDAPSDFEPLRQKRACPNPPPQGKQDDGEVLNCFSWLDEPELTGDKPWLDVDERAISEMMCSLEQDIRSNERQYAEDSSSSSSCPLTNTRNSRDASTRAENDGGMQLGSKSECRTTSESECSLNVIGDCATSIDEEIQQLLQQAEEQNIFSNFCENWDDTCSSGSSDYMVANSGVYASEDDLGDVVCNPLLGLDFECGFDCY